MRFSIAHLYFILHLSVATSLASPTTSVYTSDLSAPTSTSKDHGLALADYYPGEEFVPPDYLTSFSEHLNDLEIEYLDFFTQLRPVNESPKPLSPCLDGPEKLKSKRNLFRKLKGLFKQAERKLLGKPVPKPIFGAYCAATSLTINLYYHVVSTSDRYFGYVTEEMIVHQTNYLNKYFAPLDITFIPQDLAYRIRPDFARSEKSQYHAHRRFTRAGTYADLNVWITEDITSGGRKLLGYAAFPDATLSWKRSYDGVVIRYDTLPKGSDGDGSTLVHEVGHWLGLRHVFDETQENVTECTNTNSDFVHDTLQFPAHRPEVFQSMQVPCGGTENISQINFMSYASAKGSDKFTFTTGQKARAFSRFLGARRGLKNQMGCVTTPVQSKRSTSRDIPLPENIIDMIEEDNSDCAKELAEIRARPDISLEQSPDLLYPEYPVMPIEPAKREPELPIDLLEAPVPGSTVCTERSITERVPYLKFKRVGECICPSKGSETNPDPPVVNEDTSGCPAVCNPNPGKNSCHIHSAQNCVFPAPLASANPRSYCACAPGFKSAFGNDTSKHWRVSTWGIQNFVWVAEGIVCETKCQDVMCSEVPVLSKPCV